jgi:hypothetical protein
MSPSGMSKKKRFGLAYEAVRGPSFHLLFLTL